MRLGWPHPDYLFDVLTIDQLKEWSAFYRLEPWGFEVEERRFGMIGWAILKTVGWDGKAEDFTILPKPVLTGVQKLKALLGLPPAPPATGTGPR